MELRREDSQVRRPSNKITRDQKDKINRVDDRKHRTGTKSAKSRRKAGRKAIKARETDREKSGL